MSRKRPRGTATSTTERPRALSRKQRSILKEYGELDPLHVGRESESFWADSSERIRKVTEEELDSDRYARKPRTASHRPQMEEEDPEDDPQHSYKMLLSKVLLKSPRVESGYASSTGSEDLEPDAGDQEGELVQDPEAGEQLESMSNDQDDDASEHESGGENEAESTQDLSDSDMEETMSRKPALDPYEREFGDHRSGNLSSLIAAISQNDYRTLLTRSTLSQNVVCMTPNIPEASMQETVQVKASQSDWATRLHIKKRVYEAWVKHRSETLDPLSCAVLPHLTSYADLLYAGRTTENASLLRDAYLVHAINHVFKTRDRVLKNNTRLAKLHSESSDFPEIRDQGFTRPKILILVPFRNTAFSIVERIIQLSGSEQQENKKRFKEQFGPDEDDAPDEQRPADYQATFTGNVDDCFRIGLKFTRKSVKLYSAFYSSDILVASPLGLRLIIGAEGDKKREFDYLSSIELVIVDQCDALLMQNWDHVEHVLDHLNRIPSDAHGCDFSRVKTWYLDGQARYLRQTILMSDYMAPELNALLASKAFNIRGRVKIRPTYHGSITEVLPQLQQVFTRVDAASPVAMNNVRFEHFVNKVLPTIRQSAVLQSHTLIFVPSYFDYVRLRNHFKENGLSFASLCEYTSKADVQRARARFFHGQRSLLLFTERFHFFHRYRIRGIRHIVFYALPDHPQYYSELLNFLTLPMAPAKHSNLDNGT